MIGADISIEMAPAAKDGRTAELPSIGKGRFTYLAKKYNMHTLRLSENGKAHRRAV